MGNKKIQGKIDFIRDNLSKLHIMKKYTKEEFSGNFERLYATEHLIQITIQALVDMSNFIIASGKYRSPKNSVDTVEVLFENKLINIQERDLYQKIIRFRNIVVHFYNGVNEEVVYNLLQNNLADLESFFETLSDMI